MKPQVQTIIDDPVAPWNLPPDLANVQAAPAPDKRQQENMDAARRCHHVLLMPDGGLYPVLLTGYLTNPGLPGEYMKAIAQGATLQRLPYSEPDDDKTGSQLDVWHAPALAETAAALNVFASLLAFDLAYGLTAVYGPVFFAARVRADGITPKLPVAVKASLQRRLLVASQVLSRQHPAGLSQDAYHGIWATLKAILDEHDKRHKPSGLLLPG